MGVRIMQWQRRRFVVEQLFPLSASQIWELLGDTDHLNRTIGLPAVTYNAPVIEPNDFYRQASAKFLGLISIKWKEYPFEWVEPAWYSVLRLFEGGPLERFVGGIELVPESTGTLVRIVGEVTPRNVLGLLVARVIGQKGVQDIMAYCQTALRPTQPASAELAPRTVTPVSTAQLDLLLAKLAQMPIAPELLPKLHHHLMQGADDEVLRMQPYALADQWHVDRQEVLRLFLYATKVGLLDLKWAMMCPNCRVAKAEFNTLFDMQSWFHCDLCGVDIEADLDRYVELRFSVHASVRQAQDAMYCIGGPMNTPHIVIQQYLEPGAERQFAALLESEELRVRVLRENQVATLTPAAEEAGPLELTYTDDGWRPEKPVYRPGTVTLRLRNTTARVAVAVVERLQWDKHAVTAAQVTAMQEFRDLFASEVLAPGQEISIQNLSIFFSDLKGSTELYEAIGDAPAYGRVRRHFDFLIDCIKRDEGAVVKTIGDAVMAVFARPDGAVRAALTMQERIGEFNRRYNSDPPLVIKIGVHHGPAIAINSNNQLDYFGRTVNIAARIQRESTGGDVVLTEDIVQQPAVQEVLQRYPAAMPFTASLKGIEGTFLLYRLTVQAKAPQPVGE